MSPARQGSDPVYAAGGVATYYNGRLRRFGIIARKARIMCIRQFAIHIVALGTLIGISGSLVTCSADEQVTASGTTASAKWAFTRADILVEYRDASGKQVKHWEKFRVEDADVVAKLGAQFPGILGDRGSGPRTSSTWKSKFTILFHHESGDKEKMRVAHVSADFSFWMWRDNPPFTGQRQVENKDKLQELIEGLAMKHNVDLE